MTVLTDSLAHGLLLQGIADVEKCMENVYIMSGCDLCHFSDVMERKAFLIVFERMQLLFAVTQQVMVYVQFTI